MSLLIAAANASREESAGAREVTDRNDDLARVEAMLPSGAAPLIVCFGVGLACAALHWWLAGDVAVFAWLAGVAGSLLVCALTLRSIRRGGLAKHDASLGHLRHLLALSLLALAWGIAPLLLLRQPSLAATIALVLVLCGIAVAGASSLASSRLAVNVWLLLVLAPLTVTLVVTGSWTSIALGAAVAMFGLVVGWLVYQQNRLLLAAWRTERDNDALVRELRQQVFLVERANREKSRFLAAASHDLRQPIHAMGLFAATLEKSLSNTPLQHTVINMMRAVDALEQSFSAMLDISKLDAGVIEPNMQTFPIRDLFRRLHMHCAGEAEQLGLSLRFKPGGKLVTSDPELLERVLGNLVQNAIRYTKGGGVVVVVRTRRARTSIEVWDTGIGIAEDELPKVFDEFYQVGNPARDRSRGLGMGLAIVKRLVLLMGHELEVRSTPGRGTVFRVLLTPTQMADMDNVVLGADTVPSPLDAHQTVLFIDDEESIRVGMSEMLNAWGYQVLLADTIGHACTEVRRHAGVIDMVVSDLRLANREDGIEAIARVREVYGAPLPAILITGDTSAEEVKRAHDSGHRVLFKPVRTRELHAALRSAP